MQGPFKELLVGISYLGSNFGVYYNFAKCKKLLRVHNNAASLLSLLVVKYHHNYVSTILDALSINQVIIIFYCGILIAKVSKNIHCTIHEFEI